MGAAYLLGSYPSCTVITVFGGRPPTYPEQPTQWDSDGGFKSGDDIVAARREEDAAAVAVFNAEPVWLEFSDHQFLAPEDRPSAAAGGAAPAAGLMGRGPTAGH